jgi:hypothetical protein
MPELTLGLGTTDLGSYDGLFFSNIESFTLGVTAHHLGDYLNPRRRRESTRMKDDISLFFLTKVTRLYPGYHVLGPVKSFRNQANQGLCALLSARHARAYTSV